MDVERHRYCLPQLGGDDRTRVGGQPNRSGDVLGSGTVTGGSIGEAIRDLGKPAHYLRPGDVVEMEIEGIGVLRNTIGPNEDEDPGYRFKAKEGAFVMPVARTASETTSTGR